TCENHKAEYSCPQGTVLDIQWALFARSAQEPCPHSANSICTAQYPQTLAKVREYCQGKRSCSFHSSSSLVGRDPCPNVYKYLETRYACKWKSKIICENENAQLSCLEGFVIDVEWALYGRSSVNQPCPHYAAGTICIKKDTVHETLLRIRDLCQGNNSCSFVANTNTVLGNDPCPGIYKFLELRYVCNKIICENENAQLSCLEGFVIDVEWALYGRSSVSQPCPHDKAETICIKKDTVHETLRRIRDLCQGNNSCSFVANTNTVLGNDPCPGIYKFLELRYVC
ncbi:predicted protein, partial [Nematostella vectensis]